MIKSNVENWIYQQHIDMIEIKSCYYEIDSFMVDWDGNLGFHENI